MRGSHQTRTALFAAAAALLLLALAPSAWAQSLDSAKAAGQVGERPDGYVGLVDANAPPAVKQLVESVNAKRKAEYTRIAQQNGTPVDAVAAIAGQKLIDRTPPGQYVMGVDVRWVKK
jgi:uncharacterized protein YdbL (DUF1318 family)